MTDPQMLAVINILTTDNDLFNTEAVRKALRDFGVEGFSDIGRDLFSDYEELSTSMHDALTSSNPHALGELAHKLKGRAGYVGAAKVARLAQQLVELGRAGGTEGLAKNLAELDAVVRSSQQLLKRLPQ